MPLINGTQGAMHDVRAIFQVVDVLSYSGVKVRDQELHDGWRIYVPAVFAPVRRASSNRFLSHEELEATPVIFKGRPRCR